MRAFLPFFLMLFIPHALACTSISQYGITWTFDRDYECGQFANSDWWVVGPLTITGITPDFDGSHHGWMVNMSSDSHSFDARAPAYDQKLIPTLPYLADPGDAIIKGISTEPFSVSPRPVMKTLAVLSVVGAVPPGNGAGLFRPSFFGTDRTIHSLDEINPSLLPSIVPPQGARMPTLDWIVQRFRMMQLDTDSCCGSENLRAVDNYCLGRAENACSYGGHVAVATGDAALRLMMNDSYADKEEALVHYLQTGLDLYYQMKQGIIWYPNGGHGSGRKLPIIFAGVMLENDEIKNAVRNASFQDSTVFQEDGFLYRNRQDAVLFGHNGQYWNNVVTDYGSRTSRDPYGYIDGGHVPGTSYQEGINSAIWKGPVMAMVLMPEIEYVWNNPMFTEYVDRWVTSGAWSQPDPCAPVKGYCIGGLNDGKFCTYSNKAFCGTGVCGGGICPSGPYSGMHCGPGAGPDGNGGCGNVRCTEIGSDFWQVDFGPDPTKPGECIMDNDSSDGIGRFPEEHGKRADSGIYRSAFADALWKEYRHLPNPADTDADGCVRSQEMAAFVSRWIKSETTIVKLMEAIREWKHGCEGIV